MKYEGGTSVGRDVSAIGTTTGIGAVINRTSDCDIVDLPDVIYYLPVFASGRTYPS